MKKSLLSVSLSFLALAVLAGCGGTPASSSAAKSSATTASSAAKSSSSTAASSAAASSTAASSATSAASSSSEETAPAITVSEGKTGFAVKIAFDGVTCPSYVSIWMTGCMAQVKNEAGKITSTWNTGLNAIEMKAVTGHDGWFYGESDAYSKTDYVANLAEGVTSQVGEYALVLGYNSTADIADAKKGLQWVDAYKATYCASFAYPANAKFESEGGAKTLVTLHSDSFTAVPKKPEAPLTNYTIKVAFSESLPTWEVPHLLGSFDSWNTTWSAEADAAHCMTTTDTARKIWTFTFASIIPDTYDITMSLDYTVAAVPSVSAYSWTKPTEWAGGNLKMSVNSADGNDFVMADEDAFAATVSATDGTILADPSIQYDYLFKVVNTATTPLAAATVLYISGTINSWSNAAMTLAADGVTYSITVSAPMGSYEFAAHDTDWNHKACTVVTDDAGKATASNIKAKLPAKAATVTITADLSNFAVAKGAEGYVEAASATVEIA